MTVYVIDGQGGGIGKSLIEQIRGRDANLNVLALGCNSISTSTMIKSGASGGATGENAIVYNALNADKDDFIIGAVGIVCVNSFHGELSEKIANSISKSKATKILVPTNKCNIFIGSVKNIPIKEHIENSVNLLFSLMK